MGRTLPTYRTILEEIIHGWHRFRHVLWRADRELFDELMIKARKHADAAGYDPRMNPMESFFMSILLEIQKEIHQLKKQFNR